MLKRYIRRGNHPPLIYLYSDIECAAVKNSGLVFPSKKQDKKQERENNLVELLFNHFIVISRGSIFTFVN